MFIHYDGGGNDNGIDYDGDGGADDGDGDDDYGDGDDERVIVKTITNCLTVDKKNC